MKGERVNEDLAYELACKRAKREKRPQPERCRSCFGSGIQDEIPDDYQAAALTLDEAASELDTTPEMIAFWAEHRKIRHYRVGSKISVPVSEVVALRVTQPSWMRSVLQTDLDHRLTVWAWKAELPLQAVAEFFGVTYEEVRRYLGAQADCVGVIAKSHLWSLILAGAEQEANAVSAVEQRARRLEERRRLGIPLKGKKGVTERDQGICRYCGRKLNADSHNFDHVVPVSRGGEHRRDNIVQCCRSCNAAKKDRLPHEVGMPLRPPGLLRRGRTAKQLPSDFIEPDVPYSVLVEGETGGGKDCFPDTLSPL